MHPLRAIFLVATSAPPRPRRADVSPATLGLLARCLQRNASSRPSAAALLLDPALAEAVARVDAARGSIPSLLAGWDVVLEELTDARRAEVVLVAAGVAPAPAAALASLGKGRPRTLPSEAALPRPVLDDSALTEPQPQTAGTHQPHPPPLSSQRDRGGDAHPILRAPARAIARAGAALEAARQSLLSSWGSGIGAEVPLSSGTVVVHPAPPALASRTASAMGTVRVSSGDVRGGSDGSGGTGAGGDSGGGGVSSSLPAGDTYMARFRRVGGGRHHTSTLSTALASGESSLSSLGRASRSFKLKNLLWTPLSEAAPQLRGASGGSAAATATAAAPAAPATSAAPVIEANPFAERFAAHVRGVSALNAQELGGRLDALDAAFRADLGALAQSYDEARGVVEVLIAQRTEAAGGATSAVSPPRSSG